MDKIALDNHYREHVEELRRLYVKATPLQRAKVARDRLSAPDATPNVLITSVSATEGLARAILLRMLPPEGRSIEEIYESIRNLNPEQMVKQIAKLQGTTPEAILGETDWVTFTWAVKYRNLLIHEATFLRQDQEYGGNLIASTQRVFLKLEQIGGVVP